MTTHERGPDGRLEVVLRAGTVPGHPEELVGEHAAVAAFRVAASAEPVRRRSLLSRVFTVKSLVIGAAAAATGVVLVVVGGLSSGPAAPATPPADLPAVTGSASVSVAPPSGVPLQGGPDASAGATMECGDCVPEGSGTSEPGDRSRRGEDEPAGPPGRHDLPGGVPGPGSGPGGQGGQGHEDDEQDEQHEDGHPGGHDLDPGGHPAHPGAPGSTVPHGAVNPSGAVGG
jgi:hypothetical protein